jgi:hypothetical protein
MESNKEFDFEAIKKQAIAGMYAGKFVFFDWREKDRQI